MDITLKQLEIFEAVVVAGSITKASRRIGLSQPSISQQLAKLEEKLGSQLVQRNRTGIINLTPAGEYWYKTGDRLLRQLNRAVTEHHQRFVDNSVSMRMGMTPTLRGRFGSAAARIASEEPGFVKFELHFALTSGELAEQLRLHQINIAIMNKEAILDDHTSFHIAELFDDELAWVVPRSVGQAEVEWVLKGRGNKGELKAPLSRFVEIDADIAMRPQTDQWYRHLLPKAAPAFSANTYSMAIDLVAEGLATTHCPVSLLPNLSPNIRERLRVVPLEGLARSMVLVMPKHLMTLSSYAHIFQRIAAFTRTDYIDEMQLHSDLPLAG